MHEREDKHSRQRWSFRRWLFEPLIEEVIRAKDEILCKIKSGSGDNTLEPGEITRAFGPVTDVIDKMAR